MVLMTLIPYCVTHTFISTLYIANQIAGILFWMEGSLQTNKGEIVNFSTNKSVAISSTLLPLTQEASTNLIRIFVLFYFLYIY